MLKKRIQLRKQEVTKAAVGDTLGLPNSCRTSENTLAKNRREERLLLGIHLPYQTVAIYQNYKLEYTCQTNYLPASGNPSHILQKAPVKKTHTVCLKRVPSCQSWIYNKFKEFVHTILFLSPMTPEVLS